VGWKLLNYYGDRRVIEEAYAPMRRRAEYLRGTAKDNFVDWLFKEIRPERAGNQEKLQPAFLPPGNRRVRQ
jgi:hypothetical protein